MSFFAIISLYSYYTTIDKLLKLVVAFVRVRGEWMAGKIRCAHILVEKESVAKEVLGKLAAGESFARLAEQYSIDGSRKHGGDLGWFGHGMMVKPFEDAAFALEKGQVSGLVKTQFGYHIIKRLE